ncbi:transcription factor with AP2 domain(s), putative (ApiAP2), partial [Plasmodium malariae]
SNNNDIDNNDNNNSNNSNNSNNNNNNNSNSNNSNNNNSNSNNSNNSNNNNNNNNNNSNNGNASNHMKGNHSGVIKGAHESKNLSNDFLVEDKYAKKKWIEEINPNYINNNFAHDHVDIFNVNTNNFFAKSKEEDCEKKQEDNEFSSFSNYEKRHLNLLDLTEKRLMERSFNPDEDKILHKICGDNITVGQISEDEGNKWSNSSVVNGSSNEQLLKITSLNVEQLSIFPQNVRSDSNDDNDDGNNTDGAYLNEHLSPHSTLHSSVDSINRKVCRDNRKNNSLNGTQKMHHKKTYVRSNNITDGNKFLRTMKYEERRKDSRRGVLGNPNFYLLDMEQVKCNEKKDYLNEKVSQTYDSLNIRCIDNADDVKQLIDGRRMNISDKIINNEQRTKDVSNFYGKASTMSTVNDDLWICYVDIDENNNSTLIRSNSLDKKESAQLKCSRKCENFKTDLLYKERINGDCKKGRGICTNDIQKNFLSQEPVDVPMYYDNYTNRENEFVSNNNLNIYNCEVMEQCINNLSDKNSYILNKNKRNSTFLIDNEALNNLKCKNGESYEPLNLFSDIYEDRNKYNEKKYNSPFILNKNYSTNNGNNYYEQNNSIIYGTPYIFGENTMDGRSNVCNLIKKQTKESFEIYTYKNPGRGQIDESFENKLNNHSNKYANTEKICHFKCPYKGQKRENCEGARRREYSEGEQKGENFEEEKKDKNFEGAKKGEYFEEAQNCSNNEEEKNDANINKKKYPVLSNTVLRCLTPRCNTNEVRGRYIMDDAKKNSVSEYMNYNLIANYKLYDKDNKQRNYITPTNDLKNCINDVYHGNEYFHKNYPEEEKWMLNGDIFLNNEYFEESNNSDIDTKEGKKENRTFLDEYADINKKERRQSKLNIYKNYNKKGAILKNVNTLKKFSNKFLQRLLEVDVLYDSNSNKKFLQNDELVDNYYLTIFKSINTNEFLHFNYNCNNNSNNFGEKGFFMESYFEYICLTLHDLNVNNSKDINKTINFRKLIYKYLIIDLFKNKNTLFFSSDVNKDLNFKGTTHDPSVNPLIRNKLRKNISLLKEVEKYHIDVINNIYDVKSIQLYIDVFVTCLLKNVTSSKLSYDEHDMLIKSLLLFYFDSK